MNYAAFLHPNVVKFDYISENERDVMRLKKLHNCVTTASISV